MKKNFKILTFSFVALFAFVIASCAKGSPADQYVDLINEATASIEKCKSVAEFQSVGKELDKKEQEFLKENSDYKLTDEDKTNIKNATRKFIEASLKKGAELGGMNSSANEINESVDMIMEQLNAKIDGFTTLGQFANAFSF